MNKKPKVSAQRQLDALLDRIFYCPSCTTWRLPRSSVPKQLATRIHRRNASTWSSNTAINATKPVPSPLKPLYESLLDVRKNASGYVNTSRLQLAIQGLESSNPTIRLAILGLNVPDTARRIARLLQADALEDEGSWERQLTNGNDDYSRGLIIRFGESGSKDIPRPRNSVPVLYVPAAVLERNNIEILISSVNGVDEEGVVRSQSIPSDTFLAPVIGVPTSFDGRQTIVSQPVHGCLLVARGLDELLAVSQLLAATKFDSVEDRESIRVAVDMGNAKVSGTEARVYIVDTAQAEEGLAAIRRSVVHATEYEHKWIDSGMPALSKWLALTAAAQADSVGILPPPVRNLVASVLKAADSNIEAAKVASSQISADLSLKPDIISSLKEAIDSFSSSAHQELQSGLASAWSSRNWRKLAWYKLFWRVDDVGLIVNDLVTNAWLPKTERAVYELSGRLIQVGISPVIEQELIVQREPVLELDPDTTPLSTLENIRPTTSTIETSIPQATTVADIPQPTVEATIVPSSISSIIPHSRATYLSNATTTLTTQAQQLVLRTLSISSLSTALSALAYASLDLSVYESGTVAAVGTVFALYRMQTGWRKATRRLENDLFNEGRGVVEEVVGSIRNTVANKSVAVEDLGREGIEKAEACIGRASTELTKVVEANGREKAS